MTKDPRERLLQAIRADGRYPPEAFEFLHEGLEFTTRRVHADATGEKASFDELFQALDTLRDLARQRWGALARTVLNCWNIHRTRDFGEMVFLLVRLGLLGRQESDSIDDFDDVYNFGTAFDSYGISLDEQDD
jgi:uncharacterized repeat protein (TIGR04138 family)